MRFERGERVRVLAHPARPMGEITGHWTSADAEDPYGEDIYAVSGFVTGSASRASPARLSSRFHWTRSTSGGWRR
jgi:hypothetical protein